jgi:hypothetical protein
VFLAVAAGVVAYGLAAVPDFQAFLGEGAGLAIVVDLVSWMLWRANLGRSPAGKTIRIPSSTSFGEARDAASRPRLAALEVRIDAGPSAPVVRVLRPGESIVLGRTSKADVSIPNPLLSARHVSITVGPDGRFELQDLGSTNRTYAYKLADPGANGAWEEIRTFSGRKGGRFMLGPPHGGGTLIEIHRTMVER